MEHVDAKVEEEESVLVVLQQNVVPAPETFPINYM